MGCSSTSSKKNFIKNVIWIDENIYDKENMDYSLALRLKYELFFEFTDIKEAFQKLYINDFLIKIMIVSGKLWGRYLSFFKENLNKIIGVPYTIVFTSENYKEILLSKKNDKEKICHMIP